MASKSAKSDPPLTDGERQARLLELIEKWCEKAAHNGAIYAQGIYECADELETLVRSGIWATPEIVRGEGVDGSMPPYCRVCDHTHLIGSTCWFAKDAKRLEALIAEVETLRARLSEERNHG